jgi:hypothetical protein
MSTLLERTTSGKATSGRCSPKRNTPEKARHTPRPEDPSAEARARFLATLPECDDAPLNTQSQHELLRLLPELRRDVRQTADPSLRRQARERLVVTERLLYAGCQVAVRHILWVIEGQREPMVLPPNFPLLTRSELWRAAQEGLQEAIETGSSRRWSNHLFNCVASACRLADRKKRGRSIRPGKKCHGLRGDVSTLLARRPIPVRWDNETRWEPTPSAMRSVGE